MNEVHTEAAASMHYEQRDLIRVSLLDLVNRLSSHEHLTATSAETACSVLSPPVPSLLKELRAFSLNLRQSGKYGRLRIAVLIGLTLGGEPALTELERSGTVMPILAWKKRRLARIRKDQTLAADAVQSATCAYLAGITLLGLGANFWFHLRWVDPLAAVISVPILIIEGRRALRGEACGCC